MGGGKLTQSAGRGKVCRRSRESGETQRSGEELHWQEQPACVRNPKNARPLRGRHVLLVGILRQKCGASRRSGWADAESGRIFFGIPDFAVRMGRRLSIPWCPDKSTGRRLPSTLNDESKGNSHEGCQQEPEGRSRTQAASDHRSQQEVGGTPPLLPLLPLLPLPLLMPCQGFLFGLAGLRLRTKPCGIRAPERTAQPETLKIANRWNER